jgi:hypothetical protein
MDLDGRVNSYSHITDCRIYITVFSYSRYVLANNYVTELFMLMFGIVLVLTVYYEQLHHLEGKIMT